MEKKKDNKTYFSVDDVRHVGRAITDKIKLLSLHEEVFTNMLPSLLKQSKTDTPVIKFYEGVEGLTFLLHDLLWSKGKTIYTMWPHEEIESVLGKDALIAFNNKRIRENIHVNALWPRHMKPKEGYIWKDKDVLVKRRYAPKDMKWSMGYTIYEDKVSFISSQEEIFGFIVQSKEFSALMKLQFDVLWEQASEK